MATKKKTTAAGPAKDQVLTRKHFKMMLYGAVEGSEVRVQERLDEVLGALAVVEQSGALTESQLLASESRMRNHMLEVAADLHKSITGGIEDTAVLRENAAALTTHVRRLLAEKALMLQRIKELEASMGSQIGPLLCGYKIPELIRSLLILGNLVSVWRGHAADKYERLDAVIRRAEALLFTEKNL